LLTLFLCRKKGLLYDLRIEIIPIISRVPEKLHKKRAIQVILE